MNESKKKKEKKLDNKQIKRFRELYRLRNIVMAGYFQLDLGILKKKTKTKTTTMFAFLLLVRQRISKCAGKIKSAELQFPCGCIRVSPYENV